MGKAFVIGPATPEPIREIFARELFAAYRSEGGWSGSRAHARESWYRRTPAATMDDWRRRADALIESLAGSEIRLGRGRADSAPAAAVDLAAVRARAAAARWPRVGALYASQRDVDLLVAALEGARSELAAARAEVKAMRPVVLAAVEYVEADPDGPAGVPYPELVAAVETYMADVQRSNDVYVAGLRAENDEAVRGGAADDRES